MDSLGEVEWHTVKRLKLHLSNQKENLKIPKFEWKWKPNVTEPVRQNEGSPKSKF